MSEEGQTDCLIPVCKFMQNPIKLISKLTLNSKQNFLYTE